MRIGRGAVGDPPGPSRAAPGSAPLQSPPRVPLGSPQSSPRVPPGSPQGPPRVPPGSPQGPPTHYSPVALYFGSLRLEYIHIYIHTYSRVARRTIYTFISIQSIIRIDMQSFRQSSSRMKRVYSATGELTMCKYTCTCACTCRCMCTCTCT